MAGRFRLGVSNSRRKSWRNVIISSGCSTIGQDSAMATTK